VGSAVFSGVGSGVLSSDGSGRKSGAWSFVSGNGVEGVV